MAKQLLDPIAQKGYAYAFGEKLPEYFSDAAKIIIAMNDKERERAENEKLRKEQQDREERVRKLQEMKMVEDMGIATPEPLFKRDREELDKEMNEYNYLLGLMQQNGITSDTGQAAYRQLNEKRQGILSRYAQGKAAKQQADEISKVVTLNPEHYENPNAIWEAIDDYENRKVDKFTLPTLQKYVAPAKETELLADFEKIFPYVETRTPKSMSQKVGRTTEVTKGEEIVNAYNVTPIEIIRKIEERAAIDPSALKTFKLNGVIDEKGKYIPKSGYAEIVKKSLDAKRKTEFKPLMNTSYTAPLPQVQNNGGVYEQNNTYRGASNRTLKTTSFNTNVFGGDIVANPANATMIFPIKGAFTQIDPSIIKNKSLPKFDNKNLPVWYFGENGRKVSEDNVKGGADILNNARYQLDNPNSYEIVEAAENPLGYLNLYTTYDGKGLVPKNYVGNTAENWYKDTEVGMGRKDFLGAYPYSIIAVKFKKKELPPKNQPKGYSEMPEEKVVQLMVPADMGNAANIYNLKPVGAEVIKNYYKGMVPNSIDSNNTQPQNVEQKTSPKGF